MRILIASLGAGAESIPRTASRSPTRTPIPRRAARSRVGRDRAAHRAGRNPWRARQPLARWIDRQQCRSLRAPSPRRYPAGNGRVSTTFTPGANRSVSESTRVAPRCRSAIDHDGVGGRAATPPHRIAGAKNALVRHRGATIGALGGQPVEDASPQRRERVGRDATAKAPPPQSRRGDDRDAARLVGADDDRLPLVASAAARVDAFPRPVRRRRRRYRPAAGCPTRRRRQRRRKRRCRRGRRIPLAFRAPS